MTIEIQYDKIFDAQRHYRLLLDSMARPGKINAFPLMEFAPPAGIHAASALVGFTLLNTDVSCCAMRDDAEEITRYLVLNTAAAVATVEDADFVFLKGTETAEIVERVKGGTLSYPENSATLVIDVTGISSEARAGYMALHLKGPGIEKERMLFVEGLAPAFLEQLKIRNAEFPLGIDCILADAHWQIACLPRSTTVQH